MAAFPMGCKRQSRMLRPPSPPVALSNPTAHSNQTVDRVEVTPPMGNTIDTELNTACVGEPNRYQNEGIEHVPNGHNADSSRWVPTA